VPVKTPPLPDARTVTDSIKTWATKNPRFAALIGAGTPVVQALTRWSMELLRANQMADAALVLRAALALSPGDAMLWTNYGVALNQENLPADAAVCLERSLELQRLQPDTWLLLGMVRKKLGDATAAENAYRAALQQDSNSTAAWQFLGLLKQEQRDYATAIDCLTKCSAAGSADAALLANLGKLCYQLGRVAEAHDAYARAVALDAANLHYQRMARKCAFMAAMLRGEPMDAAIENFKNSFRAEENYADKDLQDLFRAAFSLLSGFGHLDAAARVGHKQLERWPANASVTYLLKAVEGDEDLDRSTPEYVVEYFDAFAEGFDAQLVDALGYDIPEKLCAAIRDVTPPEKLYDTFDAGCGTGLCGPLLRPLSKRLTGVDLSPKMLEMARRRAVYDAVACEELTAFLRRSESQFDLIVAADVLIYFGDLAPIFSGAASALRSGGILAVSTESGSNTGYRLQPSGRFAHAVEYVRSCAGNNFEELAFIETTIRLDASGRLPGNIFIFQKS
jgi:predicted TPR repeat methyltransferase